MIARPDRIHLSTVLLVFCAWGVAYPSTVMAQHESSTHAPSSMDYRIDGNDPVESRVSSGLLSSRFGSESLTVGTLSIFPGIVIGGTPQFYMGQYARGATLFGLQTVGEILFLYPTLRLCDSEFYHPCPNSTTGYTMMSVGILAWVGTWLAGTMLAARSARDRKDRARKRTATAGNLSDCEDMDCGAFDSRFAFR